MKIATILTNIFHYIHFLKSSFNSPLSGQAYRKGEDRRLLGYFVRSTCPIGSFYHF
jgi:hypothetical protein